MTDRTPLAVVDREGTVWPWDGREENEKLIEVGSRYVYDKKELDRLMKKDKENVVAQGVARKKRGGNPAKKPVAPESPGTQKEVKQAVLSL